MKMKQIVACAAVLAASSVAAPAFAGASANVGVFSSYQFRGVNQNPNADDLTALQGGFDYAHDSGFYVGTWASNIDFAGYEDDATLEVDVYGGYTTKVGEIGLDFGVLQYLYHDDSKLNTTEAYVGATYGPVTGKVFYTPDYFGSDESGFYYTASTSFPLVEGITLGGNIGYSQGKGPQAFVGSLYDTDPEKGYLDYGVTLSKSVDPGYTFSLAFIGTNLDGDIAEERERVVLGMKKVFSF